MNVFKQIRIDEDLLKQIKDSASKLGLSVSAWLRLSAIEKIKRDDKK
jgi:antitoxin component of RelBE/YafQ-DinJ toxin-antitoxin module